MPKKPAAKFAEVPLTQMLQVESICRSDCADSEKLEQFEQMLAGGLPMNARAKVDANSTVSGKTIIEVAAQEKCEPILLHMLRRDPLLVNSPMRLFIEVAGVPAAVRQLISNGHSIKEAIAVAPELLLSDMVNRAHPETLQMMAEQGVDLNANITFGRAMIPLILAQASLWTTSRFAHSPFNQLAALGCNMSARLDKNGFTVMHVLTAGLDEKKSSKGAWAGVLNKMLEDTSEDFLGEFRSRVSASILAGAEINAIDDCGRTALHLAAELGYIHKIQVLLESGADPAIVNHKGQTPLMAALKKGQEVAAQAIQAHRAREAVMGVLKAAQQRNTPGIT